MIEPLAFDVPGIGAFTCKPRTLAAQIAVEQSYRKTLGGDEASAPEGLVSIALIHAQLANLLAQVPEGFNLDEAHVDDCIAIFAALRSAEERFRERMAEMRQDARA
jgi:hypothetical protein